MLTKKCDRCDHQIEAPDDMAGKKVECPQCGDVNLMPGAAAQAENAKPQRGTSTMATADRAAAAGFPPSTGPEQEVMKVRRTMFRARPLLGLLLMVGLVGGVVGAGYLRWNANNSVGAIGAAAAAALSAALLLVWWVRTHGTMLTITNKRAMERDGLFSKNISEVLHDDIRNVQTHQTFRQRLLGIGDLAISSAGQSDFEIRVRDVPAPGKLREVIDLYRPL